MNIQISDIDIYDEKRDPWYSPKDILDDFELLRSVYGDNIYKSEFKKAQEMFTAAISLLGAYELSSENIYWLQQNKQSDAPDVMAAKLTEKNGEFVRLGINQMEITELEGHYPSNDIVEFLTKVKLSKPYDHRTIIVCMINRQIPIDRSLISEQLNKMNPRFTIYITGRPLNGNVGNFIIFSPYPKLTYFKQYNVNDVIKKYQILSPMEFSRGMARKISFEKAKLKSQNIYEIFGLNEKRIKEKYNKN